MPLPDGVDTVHYADLCMPSADNVDALYGDGVDTVQYDDPYMPLPDGAAINIEKLSGVHAYH